MPDEPAADASSETLDAALPTATAAVRGNKIFAYVDAGHDLYGDPCGTGTRLSKRVSGKWVELVDERPDDGQHYLDGDLIPWHFCEGHPTCPASGPEQYIGTTLEYLKTGMRDDPNGVPVPEIVSRRVQGSIRVEWEHRVDCNTKERVLDTVLELDE